MAAPIVHSKICRQSVPTLFHLSLVKVAFPMFKKYRGEMLSTILTNIQENPKATFEDIQSYSDARYNRAKSHILFIPAHLRESVLAAVYGLESQVQQWKIDNHVLIFGDPNSLDNINYHWRSDGTIDTVKTAQELVQDEEVHIKRRFEMACRYCFANSVQTLWSEMKASGREIIYCTNHMHFWVKWIRNGTRVPWTEAVLEEVFIPFRISSFFGMLQPKERQKYLPLFFHCFSLFGWGYDDLRHCLYEMTKEEKERLIETKALVIHRMFLSWPLNTFFLEIAEKMFNYLSYEDYISILLTIYELRFRKECNYREIFEAYWNMSPDHFKIYARENPYSSKKIDSYFLEKKKKLAQKLLQMSRKNLHRKNSKPDFSQKGNLLDMTLECRISVRNL